MEFRKADLMPTYPANFIGFQRSVTQKPSLNSSESLNNLLWGFEEGEII